MANSHLKKLQKENEIWVNQTRKLNRLEGIKKHLTELYPDNAHFIYELLQNAEDAHAQKVSFHLSENQLIFKHNGKKLFDKHDIEGIIGWGQGSKSDDENAIGKFGVGFKAVFSYTNSPRIFSGEYNFEIKDLFIPFEIEPIEKKKDETVFHFPLNSDKKASDIAYNEIKRGLLELKKVTLLFLSNIKVIEVHYENVANVITKFEDNDNRIVTICNSQENTEDNYLKFKKYYPGSDRLYVSIAFKIEKNKRTEKWMLLPIEKGEVAIFFPAEKEISNLKFHIHAPFASTVARDSIKDLKVNDELIELISELLCEATKWIKENNLLNLYFLRCLPNEDDNLSDFYLPIQNKIIEQFNNEAYLPCDDENFHPANCCYRASATVKEVIDVPFLKILKDLDVTEELFWLKNPTQRNSSREDKFIQLLDIEEILEKEVLEKIKVLVDDFESNNFEIIERITEVVNDYDNDDKTLSKRVNEIIENDEYQSDTILVELQKLIGSKGKYDKYYLEAINDVIIEYVELRQYPIIKFLTSKNEEWIKKTYELLFTLIEKEKNEQYWIDKNKYNNLKILILLNDGSFNLENKDCYFSSETRIKSLKRYVVNQLVYEQDITAKNQKSRQFLEYLGVKEIDIEKEVEFYLNKDNISKEISDQDHLQHIKLFLKYYEESNNVGIFCEKVILLNTKDYYEPPSHILIDKPWEKTYLQLISGDNNRFLLNDFYSEKLTKKEKIIFTTFLKDIGCHFILPIEKKKAWYHRFYSSKLKTGNEKESPLCISEDFDMEDSTKDRFKTGNIDFSLLIWNRMSSFKNDAKEFKARYCAHNNSILKTDDSSLIYTLREKTWIPDKDGVFHKPADILKDELHEKFKYNDENGWLTKIEFGKNKNQNSEELKKADETLKNNLGYRYKTIEKWKKNGYSEDEIDKLIEEDRKKKEKPDSIPNLKQSIEKHTRNIQPTNEKPNPDIITNEQSYRDKAQRNLTQNIEKSRRENRTYNTSIKVKVGKDETRQFLKEQYKGYCQICGFTFDQSGGKGKYFELFDWYSEKVIKQSSNIVDAGSTLCLCSRCHSILKHGDFSPVFLNKIEDSAELKFSDFIQHFENVKGDIEIPQVYRGINFDLYKAPVRLLKKDECIYFTEEHFLLFYNMLNLKDNSDIDYENGVFEKEEEEKVIVIKVEKNNSTEIKKKSIVKVEDTVELYYHFTGNRLKRKLVSYKTKIGSTETWFDSPLGKLIIGKPLCYVFEYNGQIIEISNIE
jgi:hypothetical protein